MQCRILLFLWVEASFFCMGLCKIAVLNVFAIHSFWCEQKKMYDASPKTLTQGFLEAQELNLGLFSGLAVALPPCTGTGISKWYASAIIHCSSAA